MSSKEKMSGIDFQFYMSGDIGNRYGVIVFSNLNWPETDYSRESLSYLVHNGDWGWDPSKNGACKMGTCLDGTDSNLRLDYNSEWIIDYCYPVTKEEYYELMKAVEEKRKMIMGD